MSKGTQLRRQLVRASLEWERYFGVAPSITSAISEVDAARLVGMKESDYCEGGKSRTAITKDTDFKFKGIRYQVIANRPSGRRWSKVKLVSRKTERKSRCGWDRLIWILYDRHYVIQESREFTADEYRLKFRTTRPYANDMLKGRQVSRQH
jgi:hypothetical protein